MKPMAILTLLFFATLLVNYFIRCREGLANSDINTQISTLKTKIVKLATQVGKNSVPVYNSDILHIFNN